jgi:hypothetical protein
MLHPKPKDVEKRKASGFGKQSAQRMRVRSLSDFRSPSLTDLKLQTFFFHRSLIGFFAKKKKKTEKKTSLFALSLFSSTKASSPSPSRHIHFTWAAATPAQRHAS